MENYKLHTSLGKGLLVSKTTAKPIQNENSSLEKKQVRFHEKVLIQWPQESERLRLLNVKMISQEKAERARKILALVNREAELDKGNSEKDPEHPNFPFPMEYKRIDFDNLDPYKLYRAAEYLREEKERFEEPFRIHAKKMRALEEKADEVCEKEWKKFEGLQRRELFSKPKSQPQPKLNITTGLSNVKVKNIFSNGSSTIIAKMNNPGGQKKKVPRYYPKPPETKRPRQPRTDSLAMRNVAVWLKSNFLIKHVPLILHQPRVTTSVVAPNPSMTANAALPMSQYSMSASSPSALKELHILDGLITASNVFNVTVGNDFDKDYDKSHYKDTLGTWNPYRFRFTVNMRGFDDNEISLYCRRPFIYVIGESPRTEKKLGQKLQETVEIPDSVNLKNLRFFRLKDGRIIIEEVGRRKKPPTTTPDPRVVALRNYYPYSV